MIALSGADLVLPDRVMRGGSILIDHGRIAALEPRAVDAGSGRTVVNLAGQTIAPGFVDVHVHGIEGIDVLDDAAAVAAVAARLPKYGVTAFCPTSVACAPPRLVTLLFHAGIRPENSVPTRIRRASRLAGRAARSMPASLAPGYDSARRD